MAAALLVLACANALADEPPYRKTSAAWTVSGTEECVATAALGDGGEVSISADPLRKGTLLLDFDPGRFGLSLGAQLAVSFGDTRFSSGIYSTKAGAGRLILRRHPGGSPEAAFRSAESMTISHDGQVLAQISLSGSAQAWRYLLDCIDRLHPSGIELRGGWVLIEGSIDEDVASEVIQRIEQAQEQGSPVRGVALSSPGGNVIDAMSLGRYVRRHGLATAVTGLCASACVNAFVGGAQRLAGEQARIGIHRAAAAELADFAEGQATVAEQGAYYHEMGIDPELALAAADVPNRSMHYLTAEELSRYGVATASLDESEILALAVPPMEPPLEPETKAGPTSPWIPTALTLVGAFFLGWAARGLRRRKSRR